MKTRLLLLVLCYCVFSGCGTMNPIEMIMGIWKKKETQETKASMVLIPAGEFEMGSETGDADEKPVHTVYLDAFYIDVYPVTNADFKKFVDANPQWGKNSIPEKYHDGGYLTLWDENGYPEDQADHPVVYVTWYAAMGYAQWAGKRLPTEAEWEKASRGGLMGKKYPWGDTEDITKTGTQMWQTPARITVIGTYPPNGYGLYDITGTVWQWCLDGYDADFYANAPQSNPISGATAPKVLVADFTSIETPRVLRGGSWTGDPRISRVADRDAVEPTRTLSLAGFRCVVQNVPSEDVPSEE